VRIKFVETQTPSICHSFGSDQGGQPVDVEKAEQSAAALRWTDGRGRRRWSKTNCAHLELMNHDRVRLVAAGVLG